MKIIVEIGGKDYSFEMNRIVYKKLLSDKDYSDAQNAITKLAREKNVTKENANEVEKEIAEKLMEGDISEALLRNMVLQEQMFYYSLILNQPEITKEEAIELLEIAIYEYGNDEVMSLCTKVMENFTQKGEEPKKKMVMRMG